MWAEKAHGAAAGCTMCAGSGVMCRVKRGTLRSGDGVIDGRIIVKNGLAIENLGNF